MKISELIKKLEDVQRKFGDLDVICDDKRTFIPNPRVKTPDETGREEAIVVLS
jgi:hypothetical protein